MPKAAATNDSPAFEEALEKLETLVESMESGDIPLDSLVAKFEEGTKLLHHCRQRLGEAEQRIEQLRQTSAGPVLEPVLPPTEN